MTGPRFSLRRVRLNAQGYELGTIARYYGAGLPVWRASSDCGIDANEFRARDRDAAKAHLRSLYPGARFYR